MEQDVLGGVFLSALARFKKVCASYPGSCDLQLVEWTIMQQAAQGDCGCGRCLNVTELQQSLHISRPGVSQSLSSLERKGYIIREIDTGDRRKIKVAVTDAGREKLAQSCQTYDSMMCALLREFGEENLAVLCEKLNALADVYDRLAGELGADG